MIQIKQVFNKYADEVSRFQYRNFFPVSTLNLNDENKKTVFKLDIEDDIISKNIVYYIEGKGAPVDSTQTYDSKSNIKLVENFVTNVFPQMEVKKHDTLIDEIDFAGIASAVKGRVSYPGPSEYNINAFNSDFNKFVHESLTFNVVARLGNLGLGFFNDLTVPIYEGGFEITFTRNNKNNSLIRWKGKKTDGTEDPASLPVEGKVTVNTFYLRVPIIEYNSEAKTNLVNDLFKENYIFQFKKWQSIQHM